MSVVQGWLGRCPAVAGVWCLALVLSLGCNAAVASAGANPTGLEQPVERPRIVWVNAVQRPWLFREGDQYRGIFYDIMMEISGRVGIDLDIREVPVRRIYTDLAEGRADVAFIPASNEVGPGDYLYRLAISPTPVLGVKLVFFALQDKPVAQADFKQFNDYRLGGQNLPPELLEELTLDSERWSSYVSPAAVLKALLADRLDIGLDAAPGVWAAADVLGVSNRIKIVHELEHPGLFMLAWSNAVAGARPGMLPEQFNEAVRDLHCDGTLTRIVKAYTDPDAVWVDTRYCG